MARDLNRGVVGRLLEATGTRLVERDHLDRVERGLQEAAQDRRLADLLAYTVLNDYNGAGQDDLGEDTDDRLRAVAQARRVWRRDPQAGRAVHLLNDFVFGRGVPRPRAKDPDVQEVLDEAWDDPQNQRILTSYDAQRRKGTDLALQSNLFFLLFDAGQDGRVKLGLLRHDNVKRVVRDPENRHRVLYYMTQERRQKWDFDKDRPVPVSEDAENKPKVLYYEHWSNLEEATEEKVRFDRPPKGKTGDGAVYHVATNTDSEMAFGWPEMQRVVRWFSAYNEFMASRVDITKAAAQFIMKRRVQGGQSQVERLASRQLTRSGEIGAALDSPPGTAVPARPGSTITENQGVVHEPFNLNTSSANAASDGSMLKSQVSAGVGFPPHYFGEGDQTSLATATAMELPVLKMVEALQEVFEGVFRWFLDRVLERAVDSGRLDRYAVDPDERVLEAHAGKGADEEQTERDLSYEFSFPNPLKRALTELVTAVTNTAQVFDPNGTNVELSRVLLNIALVAMEVDDPGDVVERIFPEGYVDPAVAAFQAQQDAAAAAPAPAPAPAPGTPAPGSVGADGKQHPPGNAYGAKQQATPAEKAMQQARLREALDGVDQSWPARPDRGEDEAAAEAMAAFDREVAGVLEDELAAMYSGNGNGNGGG